MEKAAGKLGEVKRLVKKLKEARGQLQDLVQEYAERQGREAKKLVEGDIERLRDFVSREKRELERFQKQIPAELERWKKYLAGMVGGAPKSRTSRSAKKGAKKGVRKAKKKSSAGASGATGATSQD